MRIKAVQERLIFCPIPVFFSQAVLLNMVGRGTDLRVETAWDPVFAGNEPRFIADFYACGESPDMLLRPDEATQTRGPVLRWKKKAFVCNRPFTDWSRPTTPLSGEVNYRGWEGNRPGPAARISSDPPFETVRGDLQFILAEGPRSDAFYPVVHGVLLTTVMNHWKKPGLIAVACAAQVPTDASGFTLVQGEELKQWTHRTAQRMAAMLEEAEDYAEEIARRPIGFSPNPLAMLTGSAGMLVLAVFPKAGLLAMAASALFQGVLYQSRKQNASQRPGDPRVVDFIRTTLRASREQLTKL